MEMTCVIPPKKKKDDMYSLQQEQRKTEKAHCGEMTESKQLLKSIRPFFFFFQGEKKKGSSRESTEQCLVDK